MWDGYESELIERSYNSSKDVVIGGPTWQDALSRMAKEKREKCNPPKPLKYINGCSQDKWCDTCEDECLFKEVARLAEPLPN